MPDGEVHGKIRERLTLVPSDEEFSFEAFFGLCFRCAARSRLRIRDAERRGASFLGLMATQTAIEDWTAKYPLDPWIAPREYRLSRLFAGLRSHDGNAEAARCRVFLRAHFPKARYK